MDAEALPGRDCGGCTVCCVAPSIVTEGLVKAPGVACSNCTGSGCAIYERRPTLCRDYLCAWKRIAWIPEEMRPDRSGLLIDITARDAPPGYATEITILAHRDAQDFARGRCPDLISTLVENGIAVHLSLPGPPGMMNAKGLVNDVFKDAIRLRRWPLFLERLESVVRALTGHAPVPFTPPPAP